MNQTLKLYYDTNEAADILKVNPSKIRFYEKEFKLNFKRSGRDRQITTGDIEKLRKLIEERSKGSRTMKGTSEKMNTMLKVNRNREVVKAKLLVIREFLQNTLDGM